VCLIYKTLTEIKLAQMFNSRFCWTPTFSEHAVACRRLLHAPAFACKIPPNASVFNENQAQLGLEKGSERVCMSLDRVFVSLLYSCSNSEEVNMPKFEIRRTR
jgi:hypothetical protein